MAANPTELSALLLRALQARAELRDPRGESAYRLFNGFVEGFPSLALDLYGHTAVAQLHDPVDLEPVLAAVEGFLRENLPEARSLLVKVRGAADENARRGVFRFGSELCRKVFEQSVAYALDLRLNQDASLYLDTRNLRAWAKSKLADALVLNTFAHTGSLGVAARAAPARRVVQTDVNRAFLNLAKISYGLNHWPIARGDFRSGDFFEVVGELKRQNALFDCAFLDPPFFARSEKGTVDLEADVARLLNKLRPLIGDGGRLVAVNNALFVSGADYLRQLEAICEGGYVEIDELIPVADDFAGHPNTRLGEPPVDPAPFNHSTKIAVLRVKRKDGRKAG
jgi:23S rRNA (cytosine1962-C5)-methyltransferase